MPLSTKHPSGRRASALVVAILCAVSTLAGAEPIPSDFVPVVVDVTVLDENSAPMPSMHVSAVSHEYGFRIESMSDATGLAQLDLMPGPWSFFATPSWDQLWNRMGRGYYLISEPQQISPTSHSVILEPSEQIRLQVSSSVFDFAGRDALFGFVAQP